MKKKLLTILLSVFMVMTTFTTRVFATQSFSTVGDILNTVEGGFPNKNYQNAWKNGNSVSIGLNDDKSQLSISYEGILLDRNVSGSGNLYTYNLEGVQSIIISFYLENDVLVKIEVDGFKDSYDGVYLPSSIAVGDIFNVDGINYKITSLDPKTVEVIADNPVYSQSTIEIPSTVTYSNIEFNVTSIGDDAFNNCANLTSITLPNKLTSIGARAFSYCQNIKSITLPNTIASIGESAFYFCHKLEAVICHALIPPTLGNNAFESCDPGFEIKVHPLFVQTYKNNTNWQNYMDIIAKINPKVGDYFYTDVDGSNASIERTGKKLKFTIIDDDYNNVKVELLNDAGISGELVIPESLEYANSTFTITEVDADSSDTQANSITSLNLPSTINKIGSNIFGCCGNLTAITVKAINPPTLEGNAQSFSAINKIYVSTSSVDNYKTDWSYYADKFEGVNFIIADILPEDFPTDGTSKWKNSNDVKIYLDTYGSQLYILVDGIYTTTVTSSLTPEGDNYTAPGGYFNFRFIMDDNELISIEIYGAWGMYGCYEGTYTMSKTVGDVLPTGFPTTKESGWTCLNINSPKLYLNGSDLYVDDDLLVPVDSEATKSDSGGAHYEVEYGGRTISIWPAKESTPAIINIDNYYDYYATTIMHVMATATNLPSSGSEWNNNNEKEISFDYVLMSGYLLKFDTVEINPQYSTVTYLDGNYVYTDTTGYKLTFNIYDGVLESITVSDYTDQDYNGCYTKQKFLSSANQQFNIDSDDNLEFIVTATYDDPSDVDVYIDNSASPLSTSKYGLTKGSTHVTLNNDYLKTLSTGSHTIKISVNGHNDVEQTFKVTSSPTPGPTPGSTPRYKVPNTGVEGYNNHSLLKLSSLSLLAVGTYMVIKKKKDN